MSQRNHQNSQSWEWQSGNDFPSISEEVVVPVMKMPTDSESAAASLEFMQNSGYIWIPVTLEERENNEFVVSNFPPYILADVDPYGQPRVQPDAQAVWLQNNQFYCQPQVGNLVSRQPNLPPQVPSYYQYPQKTQHLLNQASFTQQNTFQSSHQQQFPYVGSTSQYQNAHIFSAAHPTHPNQNIVKPSPYPQQQAVSEISCSITNTPATVTYDGDPVPPGGNYDQTSLLLTADGIASKQNLNPIVSYFFHSYW